jgi:chromate transporter
MTTPAVPFRAALAFWFRLGCISFGGPAGQIAIMHRELVDERRWISERRFLHALNYCMVLPGPEAQQLATYLGWLLHGVRGGVAAGLLFVLPSLVLLIALSWLYMLYGETALGAGLLWGAKAAVVAIVAQALQRLGGRALGTPWSWALALAALGLALAGVGFPWVLAGAAVVGVVTARLAPRWLPPEKSHAGGGAARTAHPAAIIDDDTPLPPHAQAGRGRLVLTVVAGVVLGLGVYALLAGAADGTLASMARFFTQAALVTFGGAYAVLPYVFDAAVRHYAWLTPTQVIDGLALGETTPGPLIMVVTFIGFVGAWQAVPAGVDPVAAGIAGACVATFFTFLPSFVFIFAGAPLIEATRSNPTLRAPLAAISAVVVGFIAQLMGLFAFHVFAPAGVAGGIDWAAVALAAAALFALLRLRRGVVEVVLAAAAIGLLRGVIA